MSLITKSSRAAFHRVRIVSIGDEIKVRLEDLETESNVLQDAYIAGQ